MQERTISGRTGRNVALEPIARMATSTHQKTPRSKVIEFAKFVREMISNDFARSAKKTAATRNSQENKPSVSLVRSVMMDARSATSLPAPLVMKTNMFRGLYVCERGSFDRFCKENPKVARIILPIAKKNAAVLMGWRTRTVAAPALLRNNGADAYEAIMSATQNLPLEIRSDVQGDMFIAVAEGRLKIADIRDRVHEFRNAHNRADRQSVFNPWGHLSLEKPLSEDGSLTLKDVLRDDQRLWS